MATIGRVEFDGLSAETRPSLMPGGADIPPGSVFVCTDTGDEFVWGGTAWAPRVATLSGAVNRLADRQLENGDLLRQVLTELTALRLAQQESYNDGRADPADFREMALNALERTEQPLNEDI